VTGQFANGGNVDNLVAVCVEGEVLWDFPNEDLSIVGGRGNDAVVERVPGLVSDGRATGWVASYGVLTSRCRAQRRYDP
jgi:hypothetical protein